MLISRMKRKRNPTATNENLYNKNEPPNGKEVLSEKKDTEFHKEVEI